jgi:hypothetical protein
MASPKDGKAVSLDAPLEPEQAAEAITADPGASAALAAEERRAAEAELDSSGVQAASAEQREAGETQQLTWISIDLKDTQGRPIPHEPYRIKLSDGTYREGSLDDQGFARIEGIPPGECQITYPRLHRAEWRRA